MPPGDVIPLQPNIEVPQHPSESRAAVNHLQVRKVKKKWAQRGPQRQNAFVSLLRRIINIYKCMRTHVENSCQLLIWIMNMGNWMFPTHPYAEKKKK